MMIYFRLEKLKCHPSFPANVNVVKSHSYFNLHHYSCIHDSMKKEKETILKVNYPPCILAKIQICKCWVLIHNM